MSVSSQKLRHQHQSFFVFVNLVHAISFSERDMANPALQREIMSFKTKKVPELELDEDYLQEARQHRYYLRVC